MLVALERVRSTADVSPSRSKNGHPTDFDSGAAAFVKHSGNESINFDMSTLPGLSDNYFFIIASSFETRNLFNTKIFPNTLTYCRSVKHTVTPPACKSFPPRAYTTSPSRNPAYFVYMLFLSTCSPSFSPFSSYVKPSAPPES